MFFGDILPPQKQIGHCDDRYNAPVLKPQRYRIYRRRWAYREQHVSQQKSVAYFVRNLSHCEHYMVSVLRHNGRVGYLPRLSPLHAMLYLILWAMGTISDPTRVRGRPKQTQQASRKDDCCLLRSCMSGHTGCSAVVL